VLLYELLTGTIPFGAGTLRRAAYAETERIIRAVEPLSPGGVDPGHVSGDRGL
jgi:hypothetical protein